MAGSLVAVFGGLLAFLEGKLELRSVRGAPQAKGDVIRYYSERTEDLECDVEQQKLQMDRQQLQIGQQEREIYHLKQTIRVLAQISRSSTGAARDSELDDQLAAMLSDTAAPAPVQAELVAVAGSSGDGDDQGSQLRARRWSKDAGWVGCATNVGTEATTVAVEMTQTVTGPAMATRDDNTQSVSAVTYPYVDSSTSIFSQTGPSNVSDTMIGIEVHADDCHQPVNASPPSSALASTFARTATASASPPPPLEPSGTTAKSPNSAGSGSGTGSGTRKISRRPVEGETASDASIGIFGGSGSGAGNVSAPAVNASTIAARALLRHGSRII